jgi:hypothetical protein
MKFVQTEGCVAYGWSIDGKSLQDFSKEERDEIFDYLIIKLKERMDDNNICLTDLVKVFHYDDYDYEPISCDQCGDSVATTTWEI